MKKILIILALTFVTSVAFACHPNCSQSSSTASIAGGVVINGATANTSSMAASGSIGDGSGYSNQYAASVTTSNGMVSASATPESATTTVNVSGTTATYNEGTVTGSALGNNEAFAAQGGAGLAVAGTTVSSNLTGNCDNPAEMSGIFGAGSAAAQGSISTGSVEGSGMSSQWSGSGAYNKSTAELSEDTNYNKTSSDVHLSGNTSTVGESWTYANGTVSGNGAGMSGGIAGQLGGAGVTASGNTKLNVRSNNSQVKGKGSAELTSYSVTGGGALAGGNDNHTGSAIQLSGAQTTAESGVNLSANRKVTKFKDSKMANATSQSYATHDSEGSAATGGFGISNSNASSFALGSVLSINNRNND